MATSSTNQGNIYSSLNLSEYMLSSLPKNASPHIRNPYDAVALLSHACMIAVGFRLVGLGEDHRISTQLIPRPNSTPNFQKQAHLLPSEAESDRSFPQPLPSEWNATTSSHYAFRYVHSQSSLQYVIKISRLGGKAVVNGIGLGDDKVHALNVTISEFLSESSFPFAISSSEEENPTQAARRIQSLFISEGRLTDLGNFFKIQIVQKLAPGLRKEGYEDSAHAASHNTSSSRPRHQPPPDREDPANDPLRDPQPARPYPLHDPFAAPPRRSPLPGGDFPPPGFDDEYDITRPPGRGGIGGVERRPLNIGERDLYPPGMGPNDPLGRGGIGGGLGGIGGGGMHPTFDDPMFGGAGYDPRAPPGARYDPVGPGDGPPSLRGGPRFPGRGGMGGAPPNPFGGFGGNDFI